MEGSCSFFPPTYFTDTKWEQILNISQKYKVELSKKKTEHTVIIFLVIKKESYDYTGLDKQYLKRRSLLALENRHSSQ